MHGYLFRSTWPSLTHDHQVLACDCDIYISNCVTKTEEIYVYGLINPESHILIRKDCITIIGFTSEALSASKKTTRWRVLVLAVSPHSLWSYKVSLADGEIQFNSSPVHQYYTNILKQNKQSLHLKLIIITSSAIRSTSAQWRGFYGGKENNPVKQTHHGELHVKLGQVPALPNKLSHICKYSPCQIFRIWRPMPYKYILLH